MWRLFVRYGFDDHESLSQRIVVRDGEMDRGTVARRQEFRQPRRGAAGKCHGRLAAREVDHAHVAPEDSPRHAGAQRLGACLLGGEALRIRCRALGASFGLRALDFCIDTADESFPVPLKRFFDPSDIDQIRPDAYNHRVADLRQRDGMAARKRLDVLFLKSISSAPDFPANQMLRLPGLTGGIAASSGGNWSAG